jgi:hypothetical protein
MILFSFEKWSGKGGMFFYWKRIYSKYSPFNLGWTPFCTVKKRYKTWFGFWSKSENLLG